MSRYYWSPSTLSFYDGALKERYEAAGSFPPDAVTVDNDAFETYGLSPPPLGQQRGAVGGRPGWIDMEPLPPPPLRTQAENALSAARVTVYNTYSILNEATPDVWVTYLKALMAIANGSDTTSDTLPTAPTL